MSIPNEDRLRRIYDYDATHNNPHSPYYDGPDEEDEPEEDEDEHSVDIDAERG